MTNRAVPLPLFPSRPARAARSRIAPWRAAALIALHVAIIAHILHWWFTGASVRRFVLADAMNTLELGEINPGFLLFAAALIVTLVAGRFLCGWACHMGALQDLTAWLLRRFGVRPRQFRSRLLGLVPLTLALYMFVWPTFKRDVLAPLLGSLWPAAAWLRPTPFPGFSLDLVSADLLHDLPGWLGSIVFLFTSGCATVYLLGPRGLCRYVCPYGGFLRQAQKAAPATVVADVSKCDQCGLCTAACTAGVRVHEQVLNHGAVRDSGCVRSLDCISVCPQRALSFRLTTPAMFRRRLGARAERYDLSLPEELLVIGAFVVVFFSTRSAYNAIPMLLAATLAAIGAFLAHKAFRLFRDANVRLGRLQLRRAGRMTVGGWAFASVMALAALLVVQSGAVKAVIRIAGRYDDHVRIPFNAVMSGIEAPADQRECARRALAWYALARPLWDGGLAIATTPAVPPREAWLHLVLRERDAAIERLRSLVRAGVETDQTGPDLARLLVASGREQDARRTLEELATKHPRFIRTREMLAWHLAAIGRSAEGEALLIAAVESRPRDPTARAALGRYLFGTGRIDSGLAALALAAESARADSDIRKAHAMALFHIGRVDDALAELHAAARARPAARAELLTLADEMRRAASANETPSSASQRSRH